MARYAWPAVIDSMIGFMAEKRIPITPEEIREIVAFYHANSAETLEPIVDNLKPSRLNFQPMAIGELPVHERPQITSVKLADINGDSITNELLVTDNLNQSVSWLGMEGGKWKEHILAKGSAPVNTTPMDIDGDGDTDFGICLMGQMHPNEELIGEFHILLNQGSGQYTNRIILNGGVPRITDCAPADYDGDGDLDVVLAMFGWRDTGELALLEQTTPLEFTLKSILKINGAMRVIPTHLNGDDKIDFLALITQQHEMIVRFLNQGDNTFLPEVIARATHPTFGSSSMHVADLDQDGDLDILWTNGDMMDENPVPKPYHGVRWLENNNWNYTLHHLAAMPGCYDAKPCDMDGDGDLDIVYSALYFQWQQADFPSLAWLENTGGFRNFKPQRIAYAPSNLANIAVGDVNGDGKPDIIGGGMHVPGPTDRAGRLTLWIQK